MHFDKCLSFDFCEWIVVWLIDITEETVRKPGFDSCGFKNRGESTMEDISPRTDTSTDADTEEKNMRVISPILPFSYFYILWMPK